MNKTSSMTYRAEIDGLRAVSVILVILFHLGWSVLPGGFIGVDVFFVISGFLITSIIHKDFHTAQFSFMEFYKRRVVRLAPAYLLVVLATSVAAFLLLLPAELSIYLKSVIYSSFFLVNFFMWERVGGYFGAEAELMPLLHLWSLALEEQFYLLWPVTLLVMSKLFRNVQIPLILLCIAGIAFSQWGTVNYPAAAYFLLPTRAFELVLGALLAFYAPAKQLNTLARNVLSIFGIGLIIFGAVFLSHDKYFPGFNALYPCVGAALVLMFAQGQGNWLQMLLGNQYMSFIGRISYPMYLWHWPIISFAFIYKIPIGFVEALACIGLTFFLSCATYLFVERPARFLLAYRSGYIICFLFLLPALLLSAFSFWGIQQKGWPSRVAPELAVKSEAILSQPHAIRGRCNQGPITSPLNAEQCVLGEASVEPRVLLIGDSHANHFTGFMDVLLKDANKRGYDITQSATPFLPHVTSFSKVAGELREYQNFQLRNDFLINHIEQHDYDFVVMGGSFAYFLNNGVWDLENDVEANRMAFKQSMRKAIEIILAQAALPVIIEGNPVPPESLADCGLNNLRFGLTNVCSFSRSDHDNDFALWHLFLGELKNEFPALIVIEVTELMCNSEHCFSELNGIPLYNDEAHLNYIGSELLGERYLKKYTNPFVLDKTP